MRLPFKPRFGDQVQISLKAHFCFRILVYSPSDWTSWALSLWESVLWVIATPKHRRYLCIATRWVPLTKVTRKQFTVRYACLWQDSRCSRELAPNGHTTLAAPWIYSCSSMLEHCCLGKTKAGKSCNRLW